MNCSYAANGMNDELRIRIDVPLGTSLEAIVAEVMEQAWRLAGTQLRAGVALGIRPETLCKRLVAWKKKISRPEGQPKV